MTTEIKLRYFEFETSNGADYDALIAAKDRATAIEVYYQELSDRTLEATVNCQEVTAEKAWAMVKASNDPDVEMTIEDKLAEFEVPGVLLWPADFV